MQEVFDDAARDAGLKRPCADKPSAAGVEAPLATTDTPPATQQSNDGQTAVPPAEPTTSPNAPTVPTVPPPGEEAPAPPWATIAFGAGAVVGAASLGIALKSAVDIGVAADETTPQIEAKALLDQGNAGLVIASVAAGVGVVSVALGAALLALEDTSTTTRREAPAP